MEILDKHRNFWSKMEILVKNRNFWEKIEVLVKNRNFCSKMEILVKNRNFWPKMEILVKNRNFWSKMEILRINRYFDQTPKLGSSIYFFPKHENISSPNCKVRFLDKNLNFQGLYGTHVSYSDGESTKTGILLCSSFHSQLTAKDVMANLLNTEQEVLLFCQSNGIATDNKNFVW